MKLKPKLLSKEWYIEKYGKELGNQKRKERIENISKPKKSSWEFFCTIKPVIEILGEDFSFTDQHRAAVEEFFAVFNDADRSLTWRKNIATWIKYGLGDWISRRQKLKECTSNSAEWFKLMYGIWGPDKHKQYVQCVAQRLPTSVQYWIKRGHSAKEAMKKISEIQTDRSKKSPLKKGVKKFSIRCVEYWTNKGYDSNTAAQIISKLQRRDLDFYIAKYGNDGKNKFNEIKAKRKETWKTKNKLEHAILATPKTFNPAGQEMQAINGFLTANNIPVENCSYGPPNQQFWQHIPNVGFRRYDLAVFTNSSKTVLKYILEYHGPGHVNFSDYHPALENETMTLDGKILRHLGTYGASYKNDFAKRQHILENFPVVEYFVIWPNDLKLKRFKIDELSKSRK